MASTNPNPPANLTNIQERLSQLTTNANSARQIIENVGRFPSLIGRLGAITTQLKEKVQQVNALAESLQIPAVTQDLSQIQNLADTMQSDLAELAALIPEGSASQSNTQDQPPSDQPQVGGFFGPFKGLFGGDDEEQQQGLQGQRVGQQGFQGQGVQPSYGGYRWSKSKSRKSTTSSSRRSTTKTNRKGKKGKQSRKHKKRH